MLLATSSERKWIIKKTLFKDDLQTVLYHMSLSGARYKTSLKTNI